MIVLKVTKSCMHGHYPLKNNITTKHPM